MMIKKRLREENGISLLEILASLSISAMIIIMVYGVLISAIHAYDKAEENVQLRDQENIILAQLNQEFLNLHDVTATVLATDSGSQACDNSTCHFNSFTYQVAEQSNGSIAYADKTMSLQGGNLIIDHSKTVNDSEYSLEGTYFTLSNNELYLTLTVKRKDNSDIRYLYAAYTLH